MINLFNSRAQIDLSVISPEAVSALSDPQQKLLATLIECVHVREAAASRVRLATARKIAAERAHDQAITTSAAKQPSFGDIRKQAIAAFNQSN